MVENSTQYVNIYSFIHSDYGIIHIGSTVNSLSKQIKYHKHASNIHIYNPLYVFINNNGGWKKINCNLIEKYNYITKRSIIERINNLKNELNIYNIKGNISSYIDNKYNTGKIYKLVHDDLGLVYIGSTKNKLSVRYTLHKYNSKFSTAYVYKCINENGGWEKLKIELIESYPCSSKHELEKRERYWIEELNPIGNKIIPTRTITEWKEENKEYCTKIMKQYREKNKLRIKDLMKNYRLKNKDYISNIKKNWYNINKKRVCERMKNIYYNNREKKLTYQKEYSEKNKDHIKEYNKNYREKNAEKLKEYKENHKEYYKAYMKEYNKKYNEKLKLEREKKKQEETEEEKQRKDAERAAKKEAARLKMNEQIRAQTKKKKEEGTYVAYKQPHVMCQVCNIEVLKGNFERHQNTVKHKKNLEIQKEIVIPA